MVYYLEYVVPPVNGGQITIPVTDHPEPTLPLGETDAEIVTAPALPVRSAVLGSSVEEAKAVAEEVISSSRAAEATLFEDPSNSLTPGSGTVLAVYTESGGWTSR